MENFTTLALSSNQMKFQVQIMNHNLQAITSLTT